MGWRDVTLAEYLTHEGLYSADPKRTWNGVSPGGAAAILGVTRAAIHNAINRNTLRAYRVSRNGKLVMILIPQRELDRYAQEHLRARQSA